MKKNGRVFNLVILAVVAAFMMVTLSSGVVFAAAAKAKAKTITVTGTLEEVGGQYVIKGAKTKHVVTGQDFAAMKGKKVKATGAVTKGDKGNVLEVTKISEVKKKAK